MKCVYESRWTSFSSGGAKGAIGVTTTTTRIRGVQV